MIIKNNLAKFDFEEMCFGAFCTERKETTKHPLEDGLTRYVGLEHLKTDKVELSNWGLIETDTPSFTKVFRKGDVLLCKRRPYLRKASKVDFDGICSSDLIVLKANSSVILPELFPHLIHTAKFWNFAVKTSSGSLSPRTKFSLLKDFIFRVPLEKVQPDILSLVKKTMEIDDLIEQAIDKNWKLIKSYKNSEMPLNLTGKTKTLNNYLTESRVEGSNGQVAKKLTVKLYGRGIKAKEDIPGSENTKYFKRFHGQFIYSKLDFLNGAFAVIPEYLDGYETTADLPAFNVSKDFSSEWLFHYVNRPDFYERFTHSAKGGRKAKRISPKDFLATEVPDFSLKTLKKQVDILDKLEEQQVLLLEKSVCMRKIREKIIFGD